MADIVDLRSRQPVTYEAEFSAELVMGLARFSEGLVSEKEIRRRFQFDESTWTALADNEMLIAAVEDEKTRRVRNGALKKERAQALVTSAPGVLGEILLDKNANAKHRIDSAKALDGLAVGGAEGAGAPAGDRFTIQINLGDTTLKFDKSIKPDSADSDTSDIDVRPWELLAAKKTDGDDGEPI